MKTPSAVKEWLTEFKTLRDSEAGAYGMRLLRRHELFQRLSEYLEHCFSKDELDPVLSQIFNCFRHPQREIFLFALQLLPSLLYVYLRNYTAWKEYGETVESLETCLLGMYNLAHSRLRTSTSVGPGSTWCTLSDFRIPSLSEPSIFHDGLPQLSPWLEREDTGRMVRTGLQLSIERRITAENRFQILTILQFLYNDELTAIPPQSMRHFLHCLERISGLDAEPRIPLGSSSATTAFLGQCLTGLYFALFNGQSSRGLAVLSCLEERATFELMPEVLLVVGAIRNSLLSNPSGQPEDGPMGISVDLAATPPAAREARARRHTENLLKPKLCHSSSNHQRKLSHQEAARGHRSEGGGEGGGRRSRQQLRAPLHSHQGGGREAGDDPPVISLKGS